MQDGGLDPLPELATDSGPNGLGSPSGPSGHVDGDSLLISKPKPSFLKRMVKTLGWSGFGLVCLIGFTILKFPETRIKNLIMGHLSSALAPMGVTLTATETNLSLWRGPRLILTEVTLSLPPPNLPLRLEEIEVAPSMLALFRGRWGASISVEGIAKTNSSFSVQASVPMKDGLTSARDLDLTADFNNWNILQFGIPASLPVKLSGQFPLSGSLHFRGNTSIPNTWDTKGNLSIKNMSIEQINVMGMLLPMIRVKDGEIKWDGGGSKIAVEKIRLGSLMDAFFAEMSGDVMLGASTASSTLKLKTKFKPSPELSRAVSILDMLLGQYKQADGAFAFELAGPLLQPMPQPLPL